MWLYHRVMSPNDAEGTANSVGPDQTAPLIWVEEQSDLGQHCLPSHICPKKDHHGTQVLTLHHCVTQHHPN